jgi:hypothetical protein
MTIEQIINMFYTPVFDAQILSTVIASIAPKSLSAYDARRSKAQSFFDAPPSKL